MNCNTVTTVTVSNLLGFNINIINYLSNFITKQLVTPIGKIRAENRQKLAKMMSDEVKIGQKSRQLNQGKVGKLMAKIKENDQKVANKTGGSGSDGMVAEGL
ncbi:MAG: hypothetical protein J5711_05815 [Bacteroidales bacterium]|nr:hypothetical protein [Bacteroidales bacterium]